MSAPLLTLTMPDHRGNDRRGGTWAGSVEDLNIDYSAALAIKRGDLSIIQGEVPREQLLPTLQQRLSPPCRRQQRS